MPRWKNWKTTLTPEDIPNGDARWTVERVYDEDFAVFGTDDVETRTMMKFREHKLPLKVPKSCETAFGNAWGKDTDKALGGKVHLTIKTWTKDERTGETASMIFAVPETPPTPEAAKLAKMQARREGPSDDIPF